MKTRVKKLMAMALTCALMLGMASSSVWASDWSKDGKVADYVTNGCVVLGSSSATATTLCYGAGATRSVSVTVYYGLTANDASTASNYSSSSAGVSATASVPSSSFSAKGGKGWHRVLYDGQSWTAVTKIGMVWE